MTVTIDAKTYEIKESSKYAGLKYVIEDYAPDFDIYLFSLTFIDGDYNVIVKIPKGYEENEAIKFDAFCKQAYTVLLSKQKEKK